MLEGPDMLGSSIHTDVKCRAVQQVQILNTWLPARAKSGQGKNSLPLCTLFSTLALRSANFVTYASIVKHRAYQFIIIHHRRGSGFAGGFAMK